MADAGRVHGGRRGARDHHRLLRRQAAALPGRLDRRARGQRDRQRPRGRRRAAGRPDPVARARGGPRGGRAAGRGRGDRRGGGEAPGSRSSPATPRWSSAVTPTGCTSARPGVGRRDPRATLSPEGAAAGRPDPALREHRRARHGDHAGPRRVRARRLDRVGHALAVAGRRRAAGGRGARAAVHARRHPGRRGVGAQRAGASLVRGDDRRRERGCRSCPRWRARRRSWGSTRCTSPTRASSWRSWRRSAAERRAAGAAERVPGCEQAAEIGEVRTEPPGMVLVQTSFGGRRVMDQLVGDPLPRIC